VSEARIDVRNLVVRYGDQVAVNGVSFTVGRGEHVTLLGPSGCGKTTTLRAIAGLEQPSGGSIHIDGQAMYDASVRRNVPTEHRGKGQVGDTCYRFVRTVLEEAFGSDALHTMHRLTPEGASRAGLAEELAWVEQLFAGKDLAGVAGQEVEQVELFGRELNGLAAQLDLAGARINP